MGDVQPSNQLFEGNTNQDKLQLNNPSRSGYRLSDDMLPKLSGDLISMKVVNNM